LTKQQKLFINLHRAIDNHCATINENKGVNLLKHSSVTFIRFIFWNPKTCRRFRVAHWKRSNASTSEPLNLLFHVLNTYRTYWDQLIRMIHHCN